MTAFIVGVDVPYRKGRNLIQITDWPATPITIYQVEFVVTTAVQIALHRSPGTAADRVFQIAEPSALSFEPLMDAPAGESPMFVVRSEMPGQLSIHVRGFVTAEEPLANVALHAAILKELLESKGG